MKTPPLFYRLPRTIAECYKGKSLIAQLVAILLTIIIVMSGFDWSYFEATRSGALRTLIWPAITLGGLIPIILPLTILLYGTSKERAHIKNNAWALGQAAMLGLFVSSFYKAFTGRIPPHFRDVTQAVIDTSHGFQFGFMR